MAAWPPPFMLYLRATAFWAVFIVYTLLFGILFNAVGWALSHDRRYVLTRSWCAFAIHLLRLTCGVRWRLEGAANIPDTDRPRIFFSKHQSTWETLALVMLLPPHVHVLKRELLRIPLVGWGLRLIGEIAIDRAAGRVAIRQLVNQGRQRLAAGRSVMIFPEGTRVRPGHTARYRVGGAILAAETGVPVVPIAHNAGEFWPRHSYVKWPGEITVVVGPEIATAGKPPEEINDEAREWIENEMTRISGRGPAGRT